MSRVGFAHASVHDADSVHATFAQAVQEHSQVVRLDVVKFVQTCFVRDLKVVQHLLAVNCWIDHLDCAF